MNIENKDGTKLEINREQMIVNGKTVNDRIVVITKSMDNFMIDNFRINTSDLPQLIKGLNSFVEENDGGDDFGYDQIAQEKGNNKEY